MQGCLEVDKSAVGRAGSRAWWAADGILVRQAGTSITACGHTEFLRNIWKSYMNSEIFLQRILKRVARGWTCLFSGMKAEINSLTYL